MSEDIQYAVHGLCKHEKLNHTHTHHDNVSAFVDHCDDTDDKDVFEATRAPTIKSDAPDSVPESLNEES